MTPAVEAPATACVASGCGWIATASAEGLTVQGVSFTSAADAVKDAEARLRMSLDKRKET